MVAFPPPPTGQQPPPILFLLRELADACAECEEGADWPLETLAEIREQLLVMTPELLAEIVRRGLEPVAHLAEHRLAFDHGWPIEKIAALRP